MSRIVSRRGHGRIALRLAARLARADDRCRALSAQDHEATSRDRAAGRAPTGGARDLADVDRGVDGRLDGAATAPFTRGRADARGLGGGGHAVLDAGRGRRWRVPGTAMAPGADVGRAATADASRRRRAALLGDHRHDSAVTAATRRRAAARRRSSGCERAFGPRPPLVDRRACSWSCASRTSCSSNGPSCASRRASTCSPARRARARPCSPTRSTSCWAAALAPGHRPPGRGRGLRRRGLRAARRRCAASSASGCPPTPRRSCSPGA